MQLDNVSLDVPIKTIQAYCAQQPIQRLSLFGSVLREDFTEESDMDMLVEYTPGSRITLLDMAQQEHDLSKLINRKVDLRTSHELSRYFRQQVIDSAVVIYERN